MKDNPHLTISQAARALREKEISSAELSQKFLDVIKEKDDSVHAYLEVFDDVIAQAKRADSLPENILRGIPIAVKDNMSISGKKVTAGSKILEGYVSPYTATAIRKLEEKGVVFIGRTNMDEFAMGSSTENSAYGPTKNPLDVSRVPGGSSGGSAAAVAAGEAIAALGSDTGGSIRQPAAFCGVVGMKPTYGAVSRYGLLALGSSLDQIGPLTNSVTDAEIIFECIKGGDVEDGTSFYPEDGKKDFAKVIGVPKGITNGLEEDVKANFESSLARLRDNGFEIKEIEMPHMALSLAVYYIIMPAEASSNLARYDGVRFGLSVPAETVLQEYLETRKAGFGAEAKRRIMLGTYVLSSGYNDEYYGSALAAQKVIKEEFKNAFAEVSTIATPTTPGPAFKLGEKTGNPVEMYLADIFTVPANISGIPAISIPSGTVERDGVSLPLGFQLMADNYREDILFSVGKIFAGEA